MKEKDKTKKKYYTIKYSTYDDGAWPNILDIVSAHNQEEALEIFRDRHKDSSVYPVGIFLSDEEQKNEPKR